MSDMNCEQIQALFDDAAHGRLDQAVDHELRRHLAECTDCRVQQQRGARLQRLLALKRYEQPPAGYFDSVAAAVHQRLAAETRPRRPWTRFAPSLGTESWFQFRYAWAGAAALAFVAGLYWLGGLDSQRAPVVAAVPDPTASAPAVTAEAPAEPMFAASFALTPSHLVVRRSAPAPALAPDPLVELVAEGAPQPSQPRYVLDRIATPVSYEMASANF